MTVPLMNRLVWAVMCILVVQALHGSIARADDPKTTPTPTPTVTPTSPPPTPTPCLDEEGNEIQCPPCEPDPKGCPPGQSWNQDECACLPDDDPSDGCSWEKCVPDHACDGEFGVPCGAPRETCGARYTGAFYTAPGPEAGGRWVEATCTYLWSRCDCSSTGSFCWPVPGAWFPPVNADVCACADPESSCE